MKKSFIVLTLLLAFGALRLPLEARGAADRVAAGLRDDAGVSLGWREQVSQASMVAVLGGLRSMAAAIWDLWACSAWEKTNYAQVERDYLFCQRVQPRMAYYYERGQWMMAYNAAHFFELQNKERGALNSLLQSAYTDKGMAMLRTGQRLLPLEPRLHEQEAILYRDKIRPLQPAKEADAWQRTAACPGAPKYARRMQAYALARVPGQEAAAEALLRDVLRLWPRQSRKPPPSTLLNLLEIYELSRKIEVDPTIKPAAYARLKSLYIRSAPSRIPLLSKTLRSLEAELEVPKTERLPEPAVEKPVGSA